MSTLPTAVLALRWPLHREALRSAIDAHVEVVGDAGDAAGALELVLAERPDLVLVEVGLPGGGSDVCTAVKANPTSATRVLILGIAGGEAELVDAVHSGADGFLSEEDGLSGLVDALSRLARGEAVIPGPMLGGLLRSLIRDRRAGDEAVHRFARLSRREREIVAHVVDGLDNASIAAALTMSPNTVRTHVQHVLRKLEVSSRLDVAALVTTHGLLDRFPITDPQGDDR